MKSEKFASGGQPAGKGTATANSSFFILRSYILFFIFLTSLFSFLACSPAMDRQEVDKLNELSSGYHYRNLDSTAYYAKEAIRLSAEYADGKAEALNNLAFVCIVRMEYADAMTLLDTIPDLTDNQLELLVSYVQQMRLCQRMSRNRAFYDYREHAVDALRRLKEERQLLNEHQTKRLIYAESELAIVTSTYYYYVGLEQKSVDALMNVPSDIEQDTAQYLNYLYNVGAGGILIKGTQETIYQQEFDHLMRCFLIARQHDYPFFLANAMEAMSEHLMAPDMRQLLIANNLPATKFLNPEGVAPDQLPSWLAFNALSVFQEYGDVYQIAGAYRTLASCYHAEGDDHSALFYLEQALSHEFINQAPDLVASIREQLCVVFAALDDKPMSDFNRNIYLDLQEQTRQDRSLEARAGQLDEAVLQLNKLLLAVAILVGILMLLVILFAYWHWRQQKQQDKQTTSADEEELEEQMDMCRLHISNGERRAVEQRAKVALVNSITPFIDRLLLEVNRLERSSEKEEESKQYISELIGKIIEQNDVLTHWIQLEKGELMLHVESFALQSLFDIVSKARMSFLLKDVTLEVIPTNAVVKADRVLTLFMLNTLADNARKFTDAGGKVTIRAEETESYIEISVEDTGAGMTEQQLAQLLTVERLIQKDDSPNRTSSSVQPSHGFGLLNCKGIIDKYRKISQLFSVCLLSAESKVGQGSRFFFRLPKGIMRLLLPLFFMFANMSVSAEDVLTKAKDYADSAYFSNIYGTHASALLYADSCIGCFNSYYRSVTTGSDTLLLMGDLSQTPPEIVWLRDSIHVNYNVILDLRNECAVAALALHQWDVYAYNNRIYTQLFKELSADATLGEYCRKMQQSQANKSIAIALLAILLLAIIAAVTVQVLHAMARNAIKIREHQNRLEMRRDDLHSLQLEEAGLHVSNAVLDNCLSALKHETMYFPSRIQQLLERNETDALPEVANYYRELYGILSEQAMRQTEHQRLHLKPLGHEILGDETLINYLFSLLAKKEGVKQLDITYHPYDQHYVEVQVAMPSLRISPQEAAHLFDSRRDHLTYLICRQIVKEHGEAIHRSDFGIKAEVHNGQTTIIMKLPRQICKISK